jgi:hypothetical protein
MRQSPKIVEMVQGPHSRILVTGISVMGMRWPDLVSNDTMGIFAGVTGGTDHTAVAREYAATGRSETRTTVRQQVIGQATTAQDGGDSTEVPLATPPGTGAQRRVLALRDLSH